MQGGSCGLLFLIGPKDLQSPKPGQHRRIKARQPIAQHLQQHQPVFIVIKNILAPIPARSDVINRPIKLDLNRPGFGGGSNS